MYNPFTLEGKKILITGAASGIGRETSIQLTKLGASLVLIDKNEKGLIETGELCHSNKNRLLITDLLDVDYEILFSDLKDITGLVHLAGIPYISPLKTISFARCDEAWRLNTFCALQLSKFFIRSKNAESIVLISSIYASVGSAANVGYAMTKAALTGITKSLAVELSPRKIRVNCIEPGFINTEMADSIDNYFDNDHMKTISDLHPLGIGKPEDVAFAIVYLLSDAARWVTGSIIKIDGGYTAR